MAIIKRTSYGRSTNTITGVAGEYISQYSLVFCNISDSGKYYNATNNILSKESDVVGIALVSVNKNEVGSYKVGGTVVNPVWSWTPGEALYLGVSGGISSYKDLPSSVYVKPIGFAESAATINLVLSSGYKEDEIEIDADQLEINYRPKGYFPNSSDISKSSTSLGSHLKGLDEATTITVEGVAGEFIPQYSVVYVDSNNKIRLAINNDDTKVDVLGIANTSIPIGQTRKVTVKGLITNSLWSWTPNKWVYLSAVSGGLAQTEPTDIGSYITPVGLAISSNTINIHAMISWPVSAASSNDELSLGFTPSFYTPTIVSGLTTSTSQLTSHLKGIDTKISGYVNIKEFGAVGDGITDDTVAIQDAIDSIASGGGVFFPFGVYIVSDQITIPSSLILLGNNATITYETPSVMGSSAAFFYINTSISNVTIRGITFNGKGTWSDEVFPYPYGSGNVTGFSNNQIGVYVGNNSEKVNILECSFTGVKWGVFFRDSSLCVCENNNFDDIGMAAIVVEDCDVVKINNNRITSVLGNMTTPGQTSIDYSCFADGIYLHGSSNITVSNNSITDCKRIGIVLEGSGEQSSAGYLVNNLNENIIISGNIITNMNSSRGAEYNGAIWSESWRSKNSCLVTENICNNIGALQGSNEAWGITAAYLTVSSNIIQGYDKGIRANNSKIYFNTVEFNTVGIYLGAQAPDVTGPSYIINIFNDIIGNRIALNKGSGILSVGNGLLTVKDNTILDNGQDSNDYNCSGIQIQQWATIANISNNTFLSSAGEGASTGQLYAICGVLGRNSGGTLSNIFSPTTTLGNKFFFTGAFASLYPSKLNIVPCSYAYVNTNVDPVTYTLYEFGLDSKSNYNSKVPTSDGLNLISGVPGFVGVSASSPISGSYRKGDYFINSSVTSNSYFGWVCVVAGTPGTWKGFGLIQA